MDLSSFIGYPKDEVLEYLDKQNIKYEIVEFNDHGLFDTELFTSFKYINNKLTLYFDKYKLNV